MIKRKPIQTLIRICGTLLIVAGITYVYFFIFNEANSIDGEKLALRLPSCAEQRGLPGIRPRKNSSSQTACCACAFLSERVGFDDGEQIRCL